MTIDADWAPESCSLPNAQRPLRIAEFDNLFRESVRQSTRANKVRLELTLDPTAEGTARDLAARESRCCSFFTFTFESIPSGLLMGIEVPTSQLAVLDALDARVATIRGESVR